MAKLINEGTPEARISGKIGDYVVVNRKSGPVIRKRPTMKRKLQESEGTLQIRDRFKMALKFIKGAANIVKLGAWPKLTPAVHQAMYVLLREAVAGANGEYFIDYSKVLLSNGTAEPPKNINIQYLPGGEIAIDYAPPAATAPQQELVIALYSPLTQLWTMIIKPWPGDGPCFTPAGYDVLEAYCFLRHIDGSNASQSVYLGSLVSPEI